jgi:5-methylcytosine-specific restriction endonuclease McrA
MNNNNKLPPTQDSRCGTSAGYHRHKNANENYCEPCRLALKQYRANWYQKNQKRLRTYTNQWRLKNKEKNKETVKRYYKKLVEENSDQFRRASNKRRAKKLANGFEIYTEQQVLDTYGSLCHICGIAIDLTAPRKAGKQGWEMSLHIDHLCPISKGGPDTLANVRPSHAQCNLRKWAN